MLRMQASTVRLTLLLVALTCMSSSSMYRASASGVTMDKPIPASPTWTCTACTSLFQHLQLLFLCMLHQCTSVCYLVAKEPGSRVRDTQI